MNEEEEVQPTLPEDEIEARQNVVEAELFQASVEPPKKGKDLNPFFIEQQSNLDRVKHNQLDDDNDDEFFHLTCHVDNAMKDKIERGCFVDLEKLIPKKKNSTLGDENRLEWVSKDGMTFLAPANDREQKINSIRKWEQAFRIYAAIYCKANPTRTWEIWQYIHMINSAATTYQWDNVAYYDVTFRQLMAEKPGRSWAKTYVQLWQLALREPLNKPQNFVQNQTGNHKNPGNTLAQGNGGQGKNAKSWRERCCWVFNRIGKCTRTKCEFDNRCSYCGGWTHSVNVCRKKLAGASTSGNTVSTSTAPLPKK